MLSLVRFTRDSRGAFLIGSQELPFCVFFAQGGVLRDESPFYCFSPALLEAFMAMVKRFLGALFFQPTCLRNLYSNF